jgi:hypothetical protein
MGSAQSSTTSTPLLAVLLQPVPMGPVFEYVCMCVFVLRSRSRKKIQV